MSSTRQVVAAVQQRGDAPGEEQGPDRRVGSVRVARNHETIAVASGEGWSASSSRLTWSITSEEAGTWWARAFIPRRRGPSATVWVSSRGVEVSSLCETMDGQVRQRRIR